MSTTGARGPIPNRDADLARPRSRKGKEHTETTKGVARPANIPPADPDWHPIAKLIWEAMQDSGQADFYQSSDWALAYSLMEDITRYKEPLTNQATGEQYFKRSGQMLQTIMSSLGDLLLTEGQRRRVRLELQAPEEEVNIASVAVISDYREALKKGRHTDGEGDD